MIIIGSTAASKCGLKFRKPKDLDVWTDKQHVYDTEIKKQGIDVKLIPTDILNLVETVDGLHCTANSLFTIKCSHLGWNNPMWNKHKSDVLSLKSQGCELIPDLYNALLGFWKVELGAKDFLSLNKNKKDFFQDNVTYVYDHDWLHEQVAYPNAPVYTHCLKANQDVLIDKTKFDALSLNDQVRMFREEITVIAIERYIVNPLVKGRYSWLQAYRMSLHKTITQLTKGWATNFIVENLEHFIKPDYTYFDYALSVVDY